MSCRRNPRVAEFGVIALTMLFLLTVCCRRDAQPGGGDVEPAGEPIQYPAEVVRIVEDGTRRETSISYECRSGDQRRDEWTEEGRKRALIWKPEIGKGFLLDLDHHVYVEIEIIPGLFPEFAAGRGDTHDASTTRNAGQTGSGDALAQSIDKYFDDKQPPDRVETRRLAPEVVEGRLCAVYEQRAVFPDGHAETTRTFRARDLSGLALRVECEAEQGSTKVITERRDIRLDVAADTFVVPADFKRVERLPR